MAGGYTAAQSLGGGPAAPIDPVNASSVYEDTDRDGLPNLLENYVYGTNPNESRTASSVVPDGYLARHGYDPSDPQAEHEWAAYPSADETPDAWGAGPLPPSHRVTVLEVYAWNRPPDYDENVSGLWANGLDPEVWRSPSGLPVSWLLTHDLNPLEANVSERVLDPKPGGDGLTVEESYRSATDPRVTDTDGDGLPDDREYRELATSPSAFSTAGAGVADGWAIRYGLNATDPRMPFRDPDVDGLSNAREFNASVELYGLEATLNGSGLDPTARATGGAAIPDGWLAREGLDPRAPGIAQRELSCASDYAVPRDVEGLDDVCLTVLDAYRYQQPPTWDEATQGPWMGGLSAATNDTDGDGIADPVEIRGWYVNVTSNLGSGADAERTLVSPDPLSADTDGDGLDDRGEFLGRASVGGRTVSFNVTDPENRDTDFDGLSDGRETLVITRQLAEHGTGDRTLDPTRRDSDGDGLEDGSEWFLLRDRASRCRNGAEDYGYTNPVASTQEILDAIADAANAELPEGAASICALLEPWGDPDADGRPNILDQDSDNDNLWDGWEAVPSTYDQSPWASVHPRSRTDPINADSDGDRLPDGWEVKYGEWNRTLQGFNLDPARWSSNHGEVSDAERDLDHDSIQWFTFHRTLDGFERERHTFRATNLVEYRNGTDPNEPSTPETALLDGWTIFWGRVYPNLPGDDVGDVYPGSPGPFFVQPGTPRPNPVTGENPTLRTLSANRFSTQRDAQAGETLVRAFDDVQTAEGETITAYLFERSIQETFEFEQTHETNPYLEDTDGDGAPDAWEVAVAGSGNYPAPLIYEGGSDEDNDGLALEREYKRHTNPTTDDTDLGGVDDGEEIDAGRNPLDPSDDISVADPEADLDCDGIEDVRESEGWSHPSVGKITTNPLVPDGDHDGLLDGHTRTLSPDSNQACIQTLQSHGVLHKPAANDQVQFLGEAGNRGDPRATSTAGDGVPDGYRIWWGFQATDDPSNLVAAYEATRPSWWTETSMGPWMWGPSPLPDSDVDGDGQTDWTTAGTRFELKDTDLDEDGLNDVNGEDPTPGARPALVPPNGWPDATATTDKETRFRSATFGVTPTPAHRADATGRDVDDDGIEDTIDQLPVIVEDLEIEEVDPTNGRYELSQNAAYTLTGRVLADRGDASPVPVPNATVIAQAVDHDHPVGADFTDAAGHFRINVTFSGTHEVPVPQGTVLFGRSGRPATFTADVTDLPRGAGSQEASNTLRAWVTNTSGASLPGDPTHLGVDGEIPTEDGGTIDGTASGIRGTVSEALPISLVTAPQLSIDVRREAPPGARVPFTLTLTDAASQGIPNEDVGLSTPNETVTLSTGPEGQARGNLTLPTTLGSIPLEATYDGGPFTQSASAETSVTVKHASKIQLTSIRPAPVIAGRNVTVEGRLAGVASTADQPIDVTTPDGTVTTTTGPNGTFQTRVPWPAQAVGPRKVSVTFNGTDTLLGDRVEAQVQALGGAHLTLTTPGDSLAPGSSIVLRARLTDATGIPLPGESLTVSGLPEGGSAVRETDATGAIVVESQAPLHPGAWQVSATFEGTGTHAADRDFGWVNVSVPTLLNLDVPDRVTRGSIATVSGTLRTSAGNPVTGQPVHIETPDRAIGTALTSAGGGFDIPWNVASTTPLGDLQVYARFNGSTDGRYQASNGLAQSLVREGLQITPTTLDLQHGVNPVTLEVHLDSGKPAPDGKLFLESSSLGLEADAAVTDATARFRLPVPESAQLGAHPVHLRYDPEGALEGASVNVTATVLAPVRLTGLSRVLATPGQTVTLTGTIDAIGTDRSPSGTIHLSLLDEARNVSASNGRFQTDLAIPNNATPGEHTLTLTWPRQDPYLGSEREVPVTIQSPVEIQANLDAATPSEPVRGTVTVRTSEGDPVAHESVLLESANGLAFLVETDEDGQARVVLPPAGTNGTQYTFHFAGRGSLATASTQTSVSAPTAAGANPWVLAGITSMILLALVGAATWYLRRRQQLLAETVADELEAGRRKLEAGSEYEAVILHAYQTFVELVAEQNVEIEDPDTLREFQGRIERVLGVQGSPIDDLFTVFETAFYGPGRPERSQRDRAISAFHRATRLLRESTEPDEVST